MFPHLHEGDSTHDLYGSDVKDLIFGKPVTLELNQRYSAVVLIRGPNSVSGQGGSSVCEADGCTFTFRLFFV
jgi:hypothetical protein